MVDTINALESRIIPRYNLKNWVRGANYHITIFLHKNQKSVQAVDINDGCGWAAFE